MGSRRGFSVAAPPSKLLTVQATRVLPLCWLTTLALAWSAVSPPVLAQQPALDSIQRYISGEMTRQQIPGVSVAILRGNQVLLARGYGYANLEHWVPASDSTIYQSGSVGKQFTASLVLVLWEQGRLGLDDRVARWFPESRGAWDSVTVRHLLTHTSGIPEYTDSTFDYRRDYTEGDLVRFAAARRLNFAPGERWSYSNTGYVLLGVLVRRITGRFYGDLLRELIFSPLAMPTARIISEADIVPNRAAGYRLVKGELKNQEWVAPTLNTTADGSLYFSLNDLIRWAVALNEGRIPSRAALGAAWTPVRLKDGGQYPYGFGCDLTGQRGHQRVGHTGSWQGFKTAIHRYPEFDLTVIALANLADAEPGAIAEGIAGILEPALRPPHLFTRALGGPKPPRPAVELLKQIVGRNDAGFVTAGFQRFWVPSARADLGTQLEGLRRWTELGCDSFAGQGVEWLGASVTYACYTRGDGPDDHQLLTIFYDARWRAAHLDLSAF
jgi:CubicO group peptidase (beta-lactamase class C family)